MRWLIPPKGAGPVESMRWARRVQLVFAVAILGIAALQWSNSGWDWLLVGCALLNLVPWGGPAGVLRRWERRPETLIADPERRRRRGRRAMWLMLLWIELILAPLGYAADGWKGVGICVAVGIVAWGFGFLVYLRLEGRV